MYWSEKHLVNVLQTMKSTATTDELKNAFEVHMEETRQQMQRIEQIFNQLGLPVTETNSIGMQGLFDEGWHVIDETDEGSFQRDVALVIAAQKVEHYEIACYGSLVNLATLLGYKPIVELLKQSLKEEKETDVKLTQLAEKQLNKGAKNEPAEEPPAKAGGKKKSVKASAKEERESSPTPKEAKTRKTTAASGMSGRSKGAKAKEESKEKK